MQSLGSLRTKTTLDIVVNPEISLNKVIKVTNNLISILIKKSLKLAHLLVIVKVLFVLRVKLIENRMVMSQCLNKLFSSSLLSKRRSLLELVVLACKALVELG